MEEKGNRYPVINLPQVIVRTPKATNVSKSTIRTIVVDEKKNLGAGDPFRFSSPTRKKERGIKELQTLMNLI